MAMGMYGSFRLARPDQIQGLIADPDQLDEFVGETIVQDDEVTREPDTLDVGRWWHGLHYLLTGTAWEGAPPLDFIARGGRLLDGEGTVRVFTTDQVREISHALEPITVDVLSARFDPVQMTRLKIYPHAWQSDALAELRVYFESLKRLLRRAAAEGLGLVVQVA